MIEKKKWCCCGLVPKTKSLELTVRAIVVTDFVLLFVITIGYISWFTLFNEKFTWY
jgi:hypothetical protein